MVSLSDKQHLWTEIGETEEEKDHMLLELEKECMAVYRRKVDEANDAKVRLRQSVAAKEAELAALVAVLGEHIRYPQVPFLFTLTFLKKTSKRTFCLASLYAFKQLYGCLV